MDVEFDSITISSQGSSALSGIDATPRAGQIIIHDSIRYKTIKEGLAYILVPENVTAEIAAKPVKAGIPLADDEAQRQSVFYNPIQQFNRDLSVLAIKAFGEESVKAKREKYEQKSRGSGRKGDRRGKKRKLGEVDGIDCAPLAEQKSGNDSSGVTDIDAINGAPVGQQLLSTEMALQGGASSLGSLKGDDPNGQEEHPNGEGTTVDWKPEFNILDALSATGLRALRYCQEVPFTTSVTANDLSSKAAASISRNVQHSRLNNRIISLTGNAISHMYQVAHASPSHGRQKGHPMSRYDVIDLDPYGTAAPFLDAAVQALKDGGLLCVTCTDSGVWASAGYPEKAYALYGGLPIKGVYSHEAGLRLILHAIATTAARYGLAIEPLLSLSIDFYARVFVRVCRSPAKVKFLAGKTMFVYNCDQGCGAWKTQMLSRTRAMVDKKGATYYKHSLAQGPAASAFCECCGFKTHLAGPMYAGPIHSHAFVQKVLDVLVEAPREVYRTADRIEGMLVTAMEETTFTIQESAGISGSEVKPVDSRFDPVEVDKRPFFFIPSALCKVIHCQGPSASALRGAFRHLGYRVTDSHCKPGSMKTDAPWPVIWEIFREWARRESPIKEGVLKEGTAGWNIMNSSLPSASASKIDASDSEEASEAGGHDKSESQSMGRGKKTATGKLNIVFDENLGREKEGRKLLRYQQNPPNWGPLQMAKGTRK